MKFVNTATAALCLAAALVRAEDLAPSPATRLPEIQVYGDRPAAATAPPPVQGARIISGKKVSVIELDDAPAINNNNYRQALALTPGLLVSEETSPLISLGYRGLEPHRAQFTQVLKDGLPIHADMLGYPEAYYTPPLDAVERIEFFRGGASLLYGPQPGGALNYVMRKPRADEPLRLQTRQTLGSHDFYSTYNALDGTSGPLGYYGYYHYREGDGFRNANQDFRVHAASLTLALNADTDNRWYFTGDYYKDEHGEPGGLTLESGPGFVNYNENRRAASRFFDEFELERNFGTLTWERDISEDTLLVLKAWGGEYRRLSRRQRGGGFGKLPDGPDANSNTIELQEFDTLATEARIRHDWEAWGERHTLTAGAMYYHVDSPRTEKRGTAPDATDGALRYKADREVHYAPVFAENRFVLGNLSLTPGLRVENIWQNVDETANAEKTSRGAPLGSSDDEDNVPLLGLGATYALAPKLELYGNASQAYRPKMFTQSVPTGGTTIVPDDLDPSRSYQFDLGLRGQPLNFLTLDASVFLLEIEDQIGAVALPGGLSTVGNVGRARHQGVEAAGELDLVGMLDALRDTMWTDEYGSLSVFANIMWLDAEFTRGSLDGKTPQYAPDYLVRSGLNYRKGDRFKISLIGTFVDEHFADDANTPERFIPSYTVWDLTAEARVYRNTASVFAGINNLFDEEYYARIRNDGIDPADVRNYYAGLKLDFF